MSICCCSLAGTAACETCSNRPYNSSRFNPLDYKLFTPIKTKKVIERFDKDGKLVERIVEE
jgi:hypothetical protein